MQCQGVPDSTTGPYMTKGDAWSTSHRISPVIAHGRRRHLFKVPRPSESTTLQIFESAAVAFTSAPAPTCHMRMQSLRPSIFLKIVRVQHPNVAGVVPAILKYLCCRLGLFPIRRGSGTLPISDPDLPSRVGHVRRRIQRTADL